jgi:hypothetical protein
MVNSNKNIDQRGRAPEGLCQGDMTAATGSSQEQGNGKSETNSWHISHYKKPWNKDCKL